MPLSVRPIERVRVSAASRAHDLGSEDRIIQDFQDYLRGLLSERPRSNAPVPRLADFRNTSLHAAPPAPVGLAAFDAIPIPRRPEASLPKLSAAIAARSELEVYLARSRRCPSCGWNDVRRSAAHKLGDRLLSVIGLVPYRCRTCSGRFHRARQTAPSPGPFRPEVSISPSRTLKIPGNLSSQGLFAAGTYSRALASIAATPGICAAKLAEWIRDAPGQVRS